VFRLYTAPLYCSSTFSDLCSSCAGYIINNIFAVQNKRFPFIFYINSRRMNSLHFFPSIFTSHPLINYPPFVFLILILSAFSKIDGIDYILFSELFFTIERIHSPIHDIYTNDNFYTSRPFGCARCEPDCGAKVIGASKFSYRATSIQQVYHFCLSIIFLARPMNLSKYFCLLLKSRTLLKISYHILFL
jgi:hypothetical protein